MSSRQRAAGRVCCGGVGLMLRAKKESKVASRFTALAGGLLLASSASCRPAPVILRGGQVHVTIRGADTCGFDNPLVSDASGCRLIDESALLCGEFGVIDEVLFVEDCEVPAEFQVLDVSTTVPVVVRSAQIDTD